MTLHLSLCLVFKFIVYIRRHNVIGVCSMTVEFCANLDEENQLRRDF